MMKPQSHEKAPLREHSEFEDVASPLIMDKYMSNFRMTVYPPVQFLHLKPVRAKREEGAREPREVKTRSRAKCSVRVTTIRHRKRGAESIPTDLLHIYLQILVDASSLLHYLLSVKCFLFWNHILGHKFPYCSLYTAVGIPWAAWLSLWVQVDGKKCSSARGPMVDWILFIKGSSL